MTTKIPDLEQQLLKCWNVVDDIDLLYESIGDSPDFEGIPPELCDKILNALLGLQTMYDLRFKKTWDIFEKVCIERIKGNIDDLDAKK